MTMASTCYPVPPADQRVPDSLAVRTVPLPDSDDLDLLDSLPGPGGVAWVRGGEGLVRFVAENARVPVIQHYQGVNHLFLDRDAELGMATALAVNAKAQRPATCNALGETRCVCRSSEANTWLMVK